MTPGSDSGDGCTNVVASMQTTLFVACCRQLLPYLDDFFRKQGHRNDLPVSVLSLLCNRLKLNASEVKGMWNSLKSVVRVGAHPLLDHLVGLVGGRLEDVRILHSLDLRKYTGPFMI